MLEELITPHVHQEKELQARKQATLVSYPACYRDKPAFFYTNVTYCSYFDSIYMHAVSLHCTVHVINTVPAIHNYTCMYYIVIYYLDH